MLKLFWILLCFVLTFASGMISACAGERVEPVKAALAAAIDTKNNELSLTVTLQVAAPWHIYAATNPRDGQQPLGLKLELPDGLEVAGDWIWPKPEVSFTGGQTQIYRGTQIFRRRMKIKEAPHDLGVRVLVSFQACNEEMCRAPAMVDVATTITLRP